MFAITAILLSLLIILIVVSYLWHIRSSYQFFTQLNIPGPRPTLFFGNFLEIIKSRRLSSTIHGWTKQYGRVFGYFQGHTPILVVSDPDILQNVFIKSFSKFHSRRPFPLEEQKSKRVNLFSSTGLRWKRQRFILNPTFSSAKLKQMTPLINRSTNMLMKKISEQYNKGQPFDIYGYFKRFTMHTIWSCAFGLDTNMQNDLEDPYLIYSQQMFGEKVNVRILVLIALFISELNSFWRQIYQSQSAFRYWCRHHIPITRWFMSENPSTWIINQAYKLIETYQQVNRKGRTDLLQLMLESASNDEVIQDVPTTEATNEETEIDPPLIRKLTKHEIAANVFLFMVAGYETTSTALGYLSYVLATHPTEQEKLQEHIDAHFNPETEDEMPSYDTISQMDYLDMFIRETFRMYPIAPVVVNRQSIEDFHIAGVGTIPAGTCIAVDMYSLHYDPDLWGPVDPHVFYPERFASKRHPMAWMPFGAGPRNCLGMRFAMTEMKLVLIRLLKTYSLISCGDQTCEPFKNLKETFVIAPKNVIIRLQRRDE